MFKIEIFRYKKNWKFPLQKIWNFLLQRNLKISVTTKLKILMETIIQIEDPLNIVKISSSKISLRLHNNQRQKLH